MKEFGKIVLPWQTVSIRLSVTRFSFRLRNWENITRLLVNVVNSVLMAIALRFVVCRAKLCLDFACTFYIFHFLACWISRSAIPTVASWWLLQLQFSINLNGAIFQLFNAMHKTLVMMNCFTVERSFRTGFIR
ncbi:Protein SYS1 [Trichinella spiralis]|uniref:Protein SYS1 n=1 Tax=Trichinella spiralis TaxID=6334 RepID=A0ABR3K317_TRISP